MKCGSQLKFDGTAAISPAAAIEENELRDKE